MWGILAQRRSRKNETLEKQIEVLTQEIETLKTTADCKTPNKFQEIDDETLLLELAHRGYDLRKRRDEETLAEIVKIAG